MKSSRLEEGKLESNVAHEESMTESGEAKVGRAVEMRTRMARVGREERAGMAENRRRGKEVKMSSSRVADCGKSDGRKQKRLTGSCTRDLTIVRWRSERRRGREEEIGMGGEATEWEVGRTRRKEREERCRASVKAARGHQPSSSSDFSTKVEEGKKGRDG